MRVTGGKLRLVPGLDEGGVGGGGDLHGGRRLGERHAAVRRDREPALRRQAAAGRRGAARRPVLAEHRVDQGAGGRLRPAGQRLAWDRRQLMVRYNWIPILGHAPMLWKVVQSGSWTLVGKTMPSPRVVGTGSSQRRGEEPSTSRTLFILPSDQPAASL